MGKLVVVVPLQWNKNKILCNMGEILECVFGKIYGNNDRWSLVIIICGICSDNMAVIIKLVIILED